MCLRCYTVQFSCLHLCVRMRVGLYICIYLYLYVYICLYVFMCLCTCTCACVCLCVFATMYWLNKMNYILYILYYYYILLVAARKPDNSCSNSPSAIKRVHSLADDHVVCRSLSPPPLAGVRPEARRSRDVT